MAKIRHELVSVVMATFNGENYLRKQMDSILRQDYWNIEVIIVDDASTDSTQMILEEYRQRDKRIHYVCAEGNVGAVASFEHALGLVTGEFIAFADQDDIFETHKISSMLAVLQANPERDMVISDLCLIDETEDIIATSMWSHQRLRVKEGKPFNQLLYMNFVTGCAMIIRRRVLNVALPFPVDCIVHDWWLAVVCCSHAGGGLVLVDQPLTLYRQHGANCIGSHVVSLQSSIERVTNMDLRSRWYRMNYNRIMGYLRSGDWSDDDLQALYRVRDAFEGISSVSEKSFLSRIKTTVNMLQVATCESIKHRLGLVVFALYPMLIDHLRNLRGK